MSCHGFGFYVAPVHPHTCGEHPITNRPILNAR
jgi:hypothetical protein